MDAASLRGMGVRRRDDDAASRRIAACRDQPCGSCSIPVTGSRDPGGIFVSRCYRPLAAVPDAINLHADSINDLAHDLPCERSLGYSRVGLNGNVNCSPVMRPT
jgi:hypothetical protein